ncbi:hypothetical protein R5R35_001874 [Gryllus longicercus]|uniref:Uncharacterized protein n=1 Tax=Gryllus longicercus TaxID=2509291 RepID=A0AAN9VWD5_9ORTH
MHSAAGRSRAFQNAPEGCRRAGAARRGGGGGWGRVYIRPDVLPGGTVACKDTSERRLAEQPLERIHTLRQELTTENIRKSLIQQESVTTPKFRNGICASELSGIRERFRGGRGSGSLPLATPVWWR